MTQKPRCIRLFHQEVMIIEQLHLITVETYPDRTKVPESHTIPEVPTDTYIQHTKEYLQTYLLEKASGLMKDPKTAFPMYSLVFRPPSFSFNGTYYTLGQEVLIIEENMITNPPVYIPFLDYVEVISV